MAYQGGQKLPKSAQSNQVEIQGEIGWNKAGEKKKTTQKDVNSAMRRGEATAE